MNKQRRSYVRETPEQRRHDLIQATLDLIGETGFRSATIRAIAARAGVTLGLIRHHFSGKEDLISAAYEHHMLEMITLGLSKGENDEKASPKQRLVAVICANLSPPVLTEQNVTLWATFLAQIPNDPGIRDTHNRTYLKFRSGLEHLIFEVYRDERRDFSLAEIKSLATVCNAIIDGLWIEGSAAPQEFEAEDLASLALKHIGTILDLNLSSGD